MTAETGKMYLQALTPTEKKNTISVQRNSRGLIATRNDQCSAWGVREFIMKPQ